MDKRDSDRKYEPLRKWLLQQAANGATTLHLTFEEIEKLISDTLPPSARKHTAWWANDHVHVVAQAWMEAGWRKDEINIAGETITLVR